MSGRERVGPYDRHDRRTVTVRRPLNTSSVTIRTDTRANEAPVLSSGRIVPRVTIRRTTPSG